MEIVQVVITGLVGVIFSILVKKENPHFSVFISLITGILIFLFAAGYLEKLMEILEQLINDAGIERAYLDIVFKIMGISYIGSFACEIAKDSGEGAIATKIDIASKILIAVTATPVILALLEMVQNFI